MSVCTANSTSAFDSILMQPQNFVLRSPPEQSDIWTSIQAQKPKQVEAPKKEAYIQQSSSLLNQKSLETCTESLGSETGSNDFFSSDDESDFFSKAKENKQDAFDQYEQQKYGFKKLSTVNYQCSTRRRSSTPRSFPPPLPSISQQDGPCVRMRTHRRDGRLVVEAFTLPSHNYLRAERHNGRLLLSFINATSTKNLNSEAETKPQEQEAEEIVQGQEEEVIEEEEEEVEVVDRGTVVEVKVSTQPQQTSMKVHRSSIVINKFVSCIPVKTVDPIGQEYSPPVSPSTKRSSTMRTTAAAAAVAASSVSVNISADGEYSSNDNKLLFASKRKNKEELLHDMKRCSELKKPLFIWEPCYIAAST